MASPMCKYTAIRRQTGGHAASIHTCTCICVCPKGRRPKVAGKIHGLLSLEARRKRARVLFARVAARPFRAVGAKTDGFKLESSVLAPIKVETSHIRLTAMERKNESEREGEPGCISPLDSTRAATTSLDKRSAAPIKPPNFQTRKFRTKDRLRRTPFSPGDRINPARRRSRSCDNALTRCGEFDTTTGARQSFSVFAESRDCRGIWRQANLTERANTLRLQI